MIVDKFTDIEAMTIAINIEKMGRQFYLNMAGKTRKKDLKPLFKKLAKQELEHLRTFEQIRVEVDENRYSFGYYDDPDVVSYLRALSRIQIFSGGKKEMENLLKKCRKAVDALVFAISIEKDSILFLFIL